MSGVQNFEDALAELSAGPPRTDHADRALRTLARRNRIRALTATGAAAAATAVAVLATTVLRGPSTTPAAGAPPSPSVAVLSYNLHAKDPSDPWYAWDPTARRYVKTGTYIRPSPDGRWGLVFDGHRMALASWTDAVHHRNLHWMPIPGPTKFSPSGSLITVDPQHKRVIWMDPATGRKASAPLPAGIQLGRNQYGFGGLADDQVMLWSYRLDPTSPQQVQRATTTVWVLNRHGEVTRTATIQDVPVQRVTIAPLAGEVGAESVPATQWLTGDPSPDGRFVSTRSGVVLDTVRRSVAFDIAAHGGRPIPVGWLPDGTVAFWTSGEDPQHPMKLNLYNTSGARVGEIPVTALPNYDSTGFAMEVDLVRAGPGTVGAVTH